VRNHRDEKPAVLQTLGYVGVKHPACAKIVHVEEDGRFRGSTHLTDESGLEILFETFDPDEVIIVAVADEDICLVLMDVCQRDSQYLPLSTSLIQIVGF